MLWSEKCMIINFILIIYVSQVFDYQITVAKFSCDKKKLETGTTSVKVEGNDAKLYKFNWVVDFKTDENCTRNQRCTLIVWKSIRAVQRFFINTSSLEIKIDNKVLLPSVQYILNCTVTNSTNVTVDFKQPILECTNATGGRLIADPREKFLSPNFIMLLGSNITYPDMMYILNAELSNYATNGYHFKWEILDSSERLFRTEPTRGSVLSLRSSVLTPEKQYIIRCSAIDTETNVSIANATQQLLVLSRGMILKLNVKKLSVGLNRAFKLSAYFEDFDNLPGTSTIGWTCLNEKQIKCANFTGGNSTATDDIKLSAIGRYTIKITVRKNKTEISDTCEINVVSNGLVNIDIDDIDIPIDPSKKIVIPAYISSLNTGCTLQWMSLRLLGYEYVDLSTMPGNVNAITYITLKEDAIMNEIDEYTNNTIDKEYNLIIATPKGKWIGLKGNASYMFSLNVTCPIPEDSDDSGEKIMKYITLTADVEVHTDTSPILDALYATPNEGTALETVFKFYTTNRVIKDPPILYKFGYLLNDQAIFFSSVFERKSCNSVLPFIDKGVDPVLEVCNSRSLCSQIVGPKVITILTSLSEDEINNYFIELTDLINREEYYRTFALAVTILQTYDGFNNKHSLKKMQRFINALIISEANRILKLSATNQPGWKFSATAFMKDIGWLLSKTSASDELFNAIVKLRSKISHKGEYEMLPKDIRSRRSLSSTPRVKRETERISLEEVKSYLVISELIITTSTDKKRVQQEKEHLLKQVDKFMLHLCGTLYEKPQSMNLELKTLVLSLEKINRNNINHYFQILRETNKWNVTGKIKLGKCFTDNIPFTNQLCLGKAIFKDYLNKDDFVYMVKVYGTKSADQLKIQDMFCDAILVLPVDSNELTNNKEAKCAHWKDEWQQSQCKTLQLHSRTIQCKCRYLGYYALEYNSMTVTKPLTTTLEPIENKTTVKPTTGKDSTTQTPTTLEPIENKTTTVKPVTANESTQATIPTQTPTTTVNTVTTVTISTTEEPVAPTLTTVSNINVTESNDKILEAEYETAFYIIIGTSLFGSIVLMYGIKRLLSNDQKKSKVQADFPKYENFCDKELLEDLSVTKTSLSH